MQHALRQQEPAAPAPPEEPADDPEGGGAQFDFKRWFDERDFKTGHPGIRGDYAYVGELIDYSPDYVAKVYRGAREPTRRFIRACKATD
jgi:hypothetical protein